jgi:RsiW-degrading membrane proteinase PrsW (M82 family)
MDPLTTIQKGDLDRITGFRQIRPYLPKVGTGALVLLFAANYLGMDWDLPGVDTETWFGHLLGLLCMTVAPGFAIGAYVDFRDCYYNESWRFLGRIFLWSALVSTLAGFTNDLGEDLLKWDWNTSTISEHFVFFFFVVGLGEELVKFIVVWKLAWRSSQFKQVYDGILFGAASALGFATNENIVYVFTSGDHAGHVALIRALTTVPLHLMKGILMGYGLGRARAVQGKAEEAEWLVLGFGGAVAVHGAYDFFLTFDSIAGLLYLVVLFGGWWLAFKVLKKGMTYSPYTHCAKCDSVLPQLSSFCQHCRSPHKVKLVCNTCKAPIDKWSRKCLKCSSRVRLPWHLQTARLRDLFPEAERAACPSCTEEIVLVGSFCLHCGFRLNLPNNAN